MLSDFQNLIEHLMDDNSLENDYQEFIQQNPALAIEYEIHTISENPNSKLSNFSIILLCRLISVLSENFTSIGSQEFHENIFQSILNLLNNPDFSSFSLSLISDLVSRIILAYSCSSDFDPNTFFFPFFLEIINSQNIENIQAAINTLAYCIYNGSIDYHQLSDQISEFLNNVFTTENLSHEILLPSMRVLYLVFDSISFEFRSILQDIFSQIKSNTELLNQSIHDIITYLPIEKYSFFDGNSSFFILYFTEILGTDELPNDLEYCSLEIIYNFSKVFYNDFSNNCELILDNIFLFLSNYETESKESKFIISQISQKYGATYTFSTHCLDIFDNILTKSSEENPNKLIAAMKLFSYCFKGIAKSLAIEIPDEFFKIIIQSGVMDNPNQSIRIVAFDMLSLLFKRLSQFTNTFHPMPIYPKMFESIANPDIPIAMISKYKAFKFYLDCLNENELEFIFPEVQDKLLELVENSTPEQLVHIFGSIEIFLDQLRSNNFDNFKEYFTEILKSPTTVPLSTYIVILQLSTYLTDMQGDIFYLAFSIIMELDFETLTGKDINSLSISIYRICSNYPLFAVKLFPLFFKFSLNGAMNDIEYTSMPFQQLTSMMNIHASIEKQNNIIKSYNGTQIQLITFYLKILRYILSINTPIIPDLIQEDGESIYNILLKWSSINFSDKIQYNALKIVHLFLLLTKYTYPFEPLLEKMINFTYSETQESRLKTLYRFIFQIFLDTINYEKMTEEIMASTVVFYSHELEKVIQNRKNICEQLNSGDCEANPNNARYLENALSMIWFPFLSNTNIDKEFFSELVDLSVNNICVTSINFLGHYYKFKEQRTDLIELLINIYISPTDEEEIENSNEPFYALDSKYAALFVISFINEKILNQSEVSLLLRIFSQRTNIDINCSLYIAIIILIADKYSDKFDSLEVLSLLNRANKLFYFDLLNVQIVVNAWNDIFPFISMQQFDTEILARLLGILSVIKDMMPNDVANIQRGTLIQNFQQDKDELYQVFSNFAPKPKSNSDDDEDD